jgi:type I restriction-modification system DNA methylase subunit
MSTPASIKPTQKSIKDYYAALAAYADQSVVHESALRSAFLNLLAETGRRFRWTLIPELSADPVDATSHPQAHGSQSVGARAHTRPSGVAARAPRGRDDTATAPHAPNVAASGPARMQDSSFILPPSSLHRIRPDGTFRDEFYIERGYWEAKDTADDLETEIKKKTAKGYPLTNTIFEDTRVAVLFQNARREMQADLTKPQELADLLNAFFSHAEPAHDNFEKAVDEFKQRVPDLARGLVDLIADSHKNNPRFIEAFDAFYDLCKSSLNPNLAVAAVDEMLVQHLLTERLIRTIFENQDFTRRNVIAAEVEKVIDALVSKSFNRHDYLRQLDRFYLAIEAAAATIGSFSEKQHFLNVVYERFFQGYSVKLADTHGIVYTPQEIVDFMSASVEEVLKTEFGKTLGDKDVHILDPCTGTGNFIVNLIRRIPKRDLPRVYKQQLFANEVMLLPYYIAALNIEHAYFEQTGQYEPFEGLCFVDSLDLAESKQAGFSFMSQENTARVERQKKAPITVIIGNPPYNTKQQDANDNNSNRKYPVVDARIRSTYVKDSAATLRMQLYDPYVRFFRWASDRLGNRDGVIAFVSNNSFVDQLTFDGMRQHLAREFPLLYHLRFSSELVA